MPTPAAYILAAVLMGPLMVRLGIDLLAGHMFLLYFAVMSAMKDLSAKSMRPRGGKCDILAGAAPEPHLECSA